MEGRIVSPAPQVQWVGVIVYRNHCQGGRNRWPRARLRMGLVGYSLLLSRRVGAMYSEESWAPSVGSGRVLRDRDEVLLGGFGLRHNGNLSLGMYRDVIQPKNRK